MAAAAAKRARLHHPDSQREVEEELSTMATQYWAEGVWTGKMAHRTRRSVDDANSRSSDVETGERTCRSGDVWDPRSGKKEAALAYLDI